MRAAVYCGTRNVYQDMIPSMKSLLIHSNVDKVYFLIEDDEFPYELPPEVECINVSHQQWFNENSPQMKNRCSYMVLLRAVFTKLFPHLDRILTIDNDTIVRENISELWDLNMSNYYIAGCTEPIKTKSNFTYINMGVAMINLKAWRENGIDEKLVQDLNTYYFEEAEQTAINIACQGHILVLNSMYNRNNYTNLDIGKEKIVHYAAIKGWQQLPLTQKYKNIEIHRNQLDDFSLDIIIPHYNNIKGLRDTLSSMDFSAAKVTVIDDCSTKVDGFEQLKKDFSMVNFLSLEHNSGPGAARQYGIEHTSNPYFMFIDAGDCIASKSTLRRAVKEIASHSQAYVLCYNWWNEESHSYFRKDTTLLPAKFFNREFTELYHLRFNSSPECSYSNEDRGFMAPCKLVLQHIASYDKNNRLCYNNNVLCKRMLDKDSITQADNGAFYWYKHIPGLAHNAKHIVQVCRDNNLHWKYPMRLITYYLVYLYECYLSCAKNHPDNLEDNLLALKYFYKNVYKQFKFINEKVLEYDYQKAVPSLLKLTSDLYPRININRFIGEIKDD